MQFHPIFVFYSKILLMGLRHLYASLHIDSGEIMYNVVLLYTDHSLSLSLPLSYYLFLFLSLTVSLFGYYFPIE